MKRLHLISLLLLISCMALSATDAFARTYSIKNVPNVQLRDKNKSLSNPDSIISSAADAQINSVLMDIRRQSSAEVVAVVVDEIDAEDPDLFATDLFNAWGIGKGDKNNGVLILVVKDRHKAVIRSGYGAEGVLPDIICGHILREQMYPNFKKEDYDAGMLAATKEIQRLLTNPNAMEELKSSLKDGENVKEDEGVAVYFYVCLGVTLLMVAWMLIMLGNVRKEAARGLTKKRKAALKKNLKTWRIILVVVGFCCLFIPLLALLVLRRINNVIEDALPICSKCQKAMTPVPGNEIDEMLSPSEQTEHRLKSVKFIGHRCDTCGEKRLDRRTLITKYHKCPQCKAQAYTYDQPVVIQASTDRTPGKVGQYGTCQHCGHKALHPCTYPIPTSNKLPIGAVCIPVGMALTNGILTHIRNSNTNSSSSRNTSSRNRNSSYNSSGSSRSSHSSGGSYGGGRTGGGGASGGW